MSTLSGPRASQPNFKAPINLIIPDKYVSTIWNNVDPNTHVQELIVNWISTESEIRQVDLMHWDEFE